MSHDTALAARVPLDASASLSSQSPAGFALVLRERTQAVHREAERAGFVADLIRGRATRDGYGLFLRNLVPVYAALEAALAARTGPLFAPFADPSLHRGAALRHDLATLAGPEWATRWPILPAADAHARAITAAATDERLIAHAYARYLGDLSGGQILKPVLARTLGLGDDALAFYDFDPALPLDTRKAALRAALDRIHPGTPEAERVVAEALAAFRHTIAVSTAVAAAAG